MSYIRNRNLYNHELYMVMAQLVKCRACNRKVAKPLFDSRCSSASLCPWERHLMLFPTWGQAVLHVLVARLTKDMQTQLIQC